MLTLAPGWELDVCRGPGCLVVKLANSRRRASETPPLAAEVWSQLERHFAYRLVLQLDEIELLTSYLLGQLVLLHKRIRDHGGTMKLCGLSPHNQEVLRLHGLAARFPNYCDLDEVVMGGCPRKPR